MTGISEREQGLIALALLLAVISAGWLAGLSPILSGFETRSAQRASAQTVLGRSARTFARAPQLRARLTDEQRAITVAAFAAPSQGAALVAARQRLVDEASAAGVRLTTLHNLPAPTSLVRLDADVRGDLGQITSFIQRLENGTPFASVDQLVINSVEAPPGQPASPLEARIVVAFGVVAPSR